MNNRLLDIQEMLYNQMKRIDNEKLSLEELTTETAIGIAKLMIKMKEREQNE